EKRLDEEGAAQRLGVVAFHVFRRETVASVNAHRIASPGSLHLYPSLGPSSFRDPRCARGAGRIESPLREYRMGYAPCRRVAAKTRRGCVRPPGRSGSCGESPPALSDAELDASPGVAVEQVHGGDVRLEADLVAGAHLDALAQHRDDLVPADAG